MKEHEFQDKPLLDALKNIGIRKFKRGSDFACIAPTWLIASERLSLEDFLDDFDNPKRKMTALRDFACMPIAGLFPFFKDPTVLDRAAQKGFRNPLSINEIGKIVIATWFTPLAGVRYYFASDLSVSRDSTGIALVHRTFTPRGDIYWLDFTLRVIASAGNTVDYEELRNVVRTLKRRKFILGRLGYDQFQSHDSATIMEKEGYPVEVVGYHESFHGCGFVWDMVHQGTLQYGDCNDVFIGEAKELQVVNSKRIDHLKTGGKFNSKDVWDAVVNACVLASQAPKEFSQEFI